MNRIDRFLDFNGRKVYFLTADGQWWIAIKPICDALGVDLKAQKKNLKGDPLFSKAIKEHIVEVLGRPTGGSVGSNQTPQTPSLQRRKMLCIPERYVYGWMAGLQSGNPDLVAYRLKCYDLLFDFFHGTITDRNALLKERTTSRMKARQLREALAANPTYQDLVKNETAALRADKALKSMDQQVVETQLPLWGNEN